jgi:outer membrane lipoprotein SlyB
MSERPLIFVYTPKDVANTALSVSTVAALGATAGTTIAPGPGTVIGAVVGGLAGFIVERIVDRKFPHQSSEKTTGSPSVS